MVEIEPLFGWDLDIGRLPELRARLQQIPEYPQAARRLAHNMVVSAEADSALDGMMKDAGRIVAALSIAYLNASGSVTLPRLMGFIAGFGLVSRGRARILLNYMRHLAYLEPDPSQLKPRPAAYRLTEKFYATYARHQEAILDAIQIIEPGVERLRANIDDRKVFDSLVLEQGAAFSEGSSQTQPFQAWYGVFMHRHAGIQILHSLVAEADLFPPTGEIRLSVAATAKRFKVSRAHITRIIDASLDQGYMERSGTGLRFSARGLEALDWLYANRLCVYLACAARAEKQLQALELESAAA